MKVSISTLLLCSILACAANDNRDDGPGDGQIDPTAIDGQSASPRAPAYETIDVDEGGSLAGTVRLSSSLPPLVERLVQKDQATCGERTPDPSLVLGKERTIANVVVSLVGVTQGKKMAELPEPAKLDQKDCVYLPHVQIVPLGTSIDIYNSDPILHNVHAYMAGGRTIFNLALPIQGFRIRRRLDDPGLVGFKCDAGHTWMSSYVFVQEHPYYALTATDGAFLIDDVPAGQYRMRTWHESLGEAELPVAIRAGEKTTMDVELAAAEEEPS